MGYANVCVSASKANTSGGTFADSLSANGTDSLNIAVFTNGKAKVLNMWGIDSDSVAELEVISTRPESTHDQLHGIRFEIPSLVPGGAASVAGHNMLGSHGEFDVFSGDTLALTVTSTAADDVLVSYVVQYDDLPGVQGTFASWPQVQGLHKSTVGINSQAQASGTAGAYGTARAFNADDARLHAGSWYALLGWTVQTQVTSITLIGPDWGGQRVGGPAGVLTLDNTAWFADQSMLYNNAPLIPCFQALNAGSINVQVADGEASTTPKIDFLLYELTSKPGA
jgi:hypothetical protein